MADLMGYLPPYYDDNIEMNEIMDAENPEIDALDMALVQVKNNQFILTADDSRIRQWEKLLRIRPDLTAQGLDYRKAIVIMRLSSRLPFTYHWLVKKLEDTVGAGNFVIDAYRDDFFLHIRLSEAFFYLQKDLREYLHEKIPLNIGLQVDELFTVWNDVLKKDYLTWGPVCESNSWEDALGQTWEDLKEATWYDVYNMQVRQRGVLGGKVWWEIMKNTWGDYKKMTWAELLGANTWQDIKNYRQEEDALACN